MVDKPASLNRYLRDEQSVKMIDGIMTTTIENPTQGLLANAAYFSNPTWAKGYFEACHRDENLRQRWLAATGSWDNQVVVDVGCGPGNLFANLGGKPKLLLGVDVSRGALEMAQSIGYTPLLADAQNMPLRSHFADIVAVNATLHHCDDMEKSLTEAARLVKPGGILIVDHDPQLSAWDFKGLMMLIYRMRLRIYQLILPTLHIEREERLNALSTELHHRPGDGVTRELFTNALSSHEFDVSLYPHNQTVGAAALDGDMGVPPHWRYRLGQRLSGIDPLSEDAALSLMCIARRK